MAYTEAERDTLKKAIATGTREVYYGDKRVVYRSLEDMRSILAEMNAEINPQQAIPKRRYAAFSNGLNGGCRGRDYLD